MSKYGEPIWPDNHTSNDLDIEPVQTSPVSETERDAARYRRLRVLGCAPAYTQHLARNDVMRFTNLDAFIDEDIAAHPSRGEAKTDGLAQSSQDRDDLRSNALILLAAEDERQSRLHALLETIREQIRLEVAPEHRPATLFQNIQDAVYAMRGRTLLMNDAAITAALSDTSTSRAREAVARWVEEPEVKDELHRRPSDSSPEHGSK